MVRARRAKRLKLVRESRGLTQWQLAERVGVRPQAISQYETNKVAPRAETLDRILIALECYYSDLTAPSDSAPPPRRAVQQYDDEM
jgi:transcriptional regulator with XRE-family HTH domain